MPILTPLLRRLNLRFPSLFVVFAILTVLDLALPDPLPLVDELGLALLTLLLGLWRDRRSPAVPRRSRRVPPPGPCACETPPPGARDVDPWGRPGGK